MLSRATVFRLVKEPEETKSHMGRATRYYMHVFDHFYQPNRWFRSWNWAAFVAALLGGEVVWMLYRRMYRYVFFYFLGWMALSYGMIGIFYALNKGMTPDIQNFLVSKFADRDFLFMSARILVWLIKMPLIISFGVWGNALYFKFLARQSKMGTKPKSGVSVVAAGTVFLCLIAVMLFGNIALQKSATQLYETAYGRLFS